jgi:hypothetical protein
MKNILFFVLILIGNIPLAQAQQKFKPSLGVHFTGDNQMFFLGLKFQGGIHYTINDRISVGLYTGYFHNIVVPNFVAGVVEWGDYSVFHAYTMIERNFAIKNPQRGIFAGLGLGFQYINESEAFEISNIRPINSIGVFRMGYRFRLKNNRILNLEITFTGPYYENITFRNRTVTHFNSVSTASLLGLRYLF